MEFDASLLLTADASSAASEGSTFYCSAQGSVYSSPDLFTAGSEVASANGQRRAGARHQAPPEPAAARCRLPIPSTTLRVAVQGATDPIHLMTAMSRASKGSAS